MERFSAAGGEPREIERSLAAVNRDSTLAAAEALRRGVRPSVLRIVAGPLARFARSYVLGLGFLRGARGLALATLDALSVFLEQAKLWELWRAPRAAPGKADAGENRAPAREEAAR